MPLGKLLNMAKTGERMSNGQRVQSRSQAIAIAASEGYLGKKAKKKSKRLKKHSPLGNALIRNRK